MNKHTETSFSRRKLLQASGALIVTAAGWRGPVGAALAQTGEAASGFGRQKPTLHAAQLDSWIAVGKDGGITAFYGKTDGGQGIDVAVAQVVAEELDVAFEKVTVVMGDSALSVNQGGASNSSGVRSGAKQLRYAAAEARRVLVEAAAQKLDIPAQQLTVEDGIVKAKDNPAKQISYAELIGGQYFNQKLEWNNEVGNTIEIHGKAQPKKVSEYKVVGKSFPRADVAGKVFGTIDYITDIKLPGMLHARVVRPPLAGATPVSIDEASLKDTGARLVRVNDLIAVVAEKEWDAVRGAQALKVTWKPIDPPFPGHNGLHDHIRAAKPTKERITLNAEGRDAAFQNAAKVIEAEYEWPFQSHASMGPACAIVEVKGDKATLYTASPKSHYAAEGVASMIGLKPEDVHAIWVRGPGAYGRNDADDTAAECAIIAKATGRPVRLQQMRHDATAWDPKAPAGVHSVRAAFDGAGNLTAYEFQAKGFSTVDVSANGSSPPDLLVGQVFGASTAKRKYEFNVPADSYQFPNKHMVWRTIAPLLDRASPLRTSHLRDTGGPQLHFAGECFVDEMAVHTGTDPVAFRLKYLAKDREKAVIHAVVEKAGWEPRTSARKLKTAAGIWTGQGIAYTFRGGTYVAMIADVEVDPAAGRVWARKLTVAHDCGLIVNPGELRRVIEAGVVQASSRAMREEVLFDKAKVLSVDWATYPIAEMADAPGSIEIVLIERPNVASSGAGEPIARPVAAAIANAVYDATGARLRRAPFTPERVKAAIDALADRRAQN
jgi:CO/xanthine dehydrogenase Mo-binding subunit